MRSRILNKKILKRKANEESIVSSKLESVCIDRPVGGIGDVLMATVAMREFKRENPGVKLTVAIDRHTTYDDTYYKLIYNAQFIDEIVDSRYVNKRKYDAYYNIRSVCIQREHSKLPPINRIDIFAKACGVKKIKNHVPFYKEESHEEVWANHFLKKYKKRIFIHTASNEEKRSYDKDNLADLIELILKDFPEYYLLISDFNKILDQEIFKKEKVINVSSLNIRESASVIKRSDFFFGPDSGLMHLAGAVGTKSLVAFGSIPPEVRINYYPTHTAIKNESLKCIGCWYAKCDKNIKCMKDLNPQKVLLKIKELL